MTDPRRLVPAIEALLGTEAYERIEANHGRTQAVRAARAAAEMLRHELAAGTADATSSNDPDSLAELAAELAEEWLKETESPSLLGVINATGVVIHTNLGRAPLPRAARAAMARAATGYSNLEYDLEKGERGTRYLHCAELLRELTGAEDALVLNNAAAALVLAANALAPNGGVVISRGELIEIGGGFRIAEIVERAGVRLIEVGSTNRTRLADYRDGLAVPGARLLLKVHRSNFRVSGFTEEVGVGDLAALARRRGLPLVHDLGSGLLSRRAAPCLDEPTPSESVAAGAQITIFSGDKLLGGPQAGIVVGSREHVGRMRRNPLCRALRVDKVTLAGLEAVLRLHRDPEWSRTEVPALKMLTVSKASLWRAAEAIVAELRANGVGADVREVTGLVGGGACPDAHLPGHAVFLDPAEGDPETIAEALRQGEPPVVARIVDDRLVLDPRTVRHCEQSDVAQAVARAVGKLE